MYTKYRSYFITYKGKRTYCHPSIKKVVTITGFPVKEEDRPFFDHTELILESTKPITLNNIKKHYPELLV
jgi:hypothetical protein